MTSNITIVCGPPGAGKTTFVLDNKSDDDLVIDLDEIFQALTMLPAYYKPANLMHYAIKTREFLYGLIKEDNTARHIWIIECLPRIKDRYEMQKIFDAKVIMIEISTMGCLNRILNDKRRANKLDCWEAIINKWWKNYEKCDRDIVFKENDAWGRSLND